uniref:Fasciculation and elongation protein zeta 1 n=1 Tax=Serinus canaria TaxID=9135 RepID=A0A8C9UDV4_SERCA
MEAPLVSLEEEFEEGPGDDGGSPPRPTDPALAELESFSAEMMSFKSMEDLVQEFDEKLTVCFRNYDAATEGLAPVRGRLQAQEEEERLQDEELPSLCLLQLGGKEEEEEEEEELTERSEQDSGINEEPLLTAEQVIEELEELMQSSPDPEADPEGEEDEDEDEEEDEEEETKADPILLRELHAFSPAFNNNCSHEGMASLSAGLLWDLARRALGKNCEEHRDLALVWKVQRRPRRCPKGCSTSAGRFSMEGISSILHSGLRQTFGPTTNEKQYLNTVIPYEKKGSPPSVEDLQMLTNSEYSFKLLSWVSISFWGHKGTFCFASVAAVWGVIAAQPVWGILCSIAAWAL